MVPHRAIDMANLGLAMSENNQKIKDFVHANVREVKQYQKYVNIALDSCVCKLAADHTPVANTYVPFQLDNGSMEVQDGLITIRPGQRVQINVAIGFTSTNGKYANVNFYIKDATNDVNIQMVKFLQNNTQYEPPHCAYAQYENASDAECQIGLYVDTVNVSDAMRTEYCSFTVAEIGRQTAIDPVNYVNTQSGIEDTPVGHIMFYMGASAPKHYLVCDGSEYNITDYPYLSQHIEDGFGAFNHFGGDGIDTFAVPNLQNSGWSDVSIPILCCVKYEPTYFYADTVQNNDPELEQTIEQLGLILDEINGEVV